MNKIHVIEAVLKLIENFHFTSDTDTVEIDETVELPSGTKKKITITIASLAIIVACVTNGCALHVTPSSLDVSVHGFTCCHTNQVATTVK